MEAFAYESAVSLTRKVRRALQRMPATHSGDDSGLTCIWDELCVQVQGSQSVLWEYYEDTALQLLDGLVSQLTRHEVAALWLQTAEGEDWCDYQPDAKNSEPPVCVEDVCGYLLNDFVLEEAERWTNARIREYLDRDGLS